MKIISNGSKWLGQEPDSIETLIALLEREPLDPSFEAYGNFVYQVEDNSGNWIAHGNFFHYSHVFQIEGTLAEITPILLAILENQSSAAYKDARKQFSPSELTPMPNPGRVIYQHQLSIL